MYEQILDEVENLVDEKYRQFHGKLIPDVKSEFLGVRVPILRELAKRLQKEDWRTFLKEYENTNIYEMIMLYGMVMAGAKCEFEEKLSYIKSFVPQIDNWAVCDIVCGDLKCVKKHLPEMYEFIQPYLKSEKEYELRFGVVILMQYYLNEDYIDRVLFWYKNIQHNGYYVKMAVAWGISVCFVKFRDKTLEFLENSELDVFTHNKAIQKIRESNRVSLKDKLLINNMKKQNR